MTYDKEKNRYYLLPGCPIPTGEEFIKLPKEQQDRLIKEVLSIKYLYVWQQVHKKRK